MKPLLPLVLVLAVVPCLAQEPCEPVRLAPPAVVPATNFGSGVAVDGDFWFVADNAARTFCAGDPFNCAGGAVHVYAMVDGALEFRQMLRSTDPQFQEVFGRSIDAQGGRLLVGSIRTTWPGVEAKGGGFIFEHDGARWVQTATLRPPEHISRIFTDELGGFAAIEGDSAYLRPANREFVFSYVKQGDEWQFHEMIECPDALPRDAAFGVPVEAGGDWVFISAYRDASLVRFGGSVYAYRRQPDGTLTFVQKIVPTEAPGGPALALGFGTDLSFDGHTLAIGVGGAFRPEPDTGAVMLYELIDGRWAYQQEVTHEAAEQLDLLGRFAVVVEGDLLLAQAAGQASATSSAALHLFRRGLDGRWSYDRQLQPNPPQYASGFANGLATDGRHAVAGTPDDGDPSGLRPGAAYFFDLTCTDCPPDLDADGTLTVFDFLTFLNLFQDADPIADFDGDGELTIFDFLAFQTAFDAGCE